MTDKKTLYKKELPIKEVLPKSFDLVKSKGGIIKTIKRSPFYNDEPKLFSYYAIFSKNFKKISSSDEEEYAGGTSLSKERAFVATLGEAIERCCLSAYKDSRLQIYSYNQIKDRAIDIFEYLNFSQKQLIKREFAKFNFDVKTKFRWTKGFSLSRNKYVFVPAQLVYVPYKFIKEEKVIREPISTGAASGTSLGAAIYRGICEVVERDAFMLTYLSKSVKPKIDLRKVTGELKELYDSYERYNLELQLVDITTDINFPAHLGILIDKTGMGPAISTGLGADVNSYKSALRATEEAFHSRTWIRKEMFNKNQNRDVCTTEGRGLYWADIKKIQDIKFLISGSFKILDSSLKQDLSYLPSKLKSALDIMKKANMEIVVVDLTTKEASKANFYVVKVLIADLHPLYLNECYPYLGGKRLERISGELGISYDQLNRVPHPFL